MKLDHECVRDVLLYLEENLEINNNVKASRIQIPEKTTEEIIYTCQKLMEASYINGSKVATLGGISDVFIRSITWDGHQFLDNIRTPEVWQKTKGIATEIGSTSINILSTIASQVITSMITSKLPI